MMQYYEMISKLDEVLETPIRSRKRAAGAAMCAGCGAVALDWEPAPIDVKLVQLPKASIAGVWSIPAIVIRRTLAEIVVELLPDSIVGKCAVVTDTNHQIQCPDYVTMYTRRRSAITVHRGKGTRFRKCRVCERVLPDTFKDPEHLVSSETQDRPVVQSLDPFIFLSESAIESRDWSQYHDIKFKPIPCLDRALDESDMINFDPTR